MRTFIAISISDEIRDKIRVLQKRFYKKGLSASRETHITLRFFGEISNNELLEIIDKLRKIEFKKFDISIDGFGFFEHMGKLKVVFLKVYSKELLELISLINQKVPNINPKYIKDIPHITLFRAKSKSIKKEDFVFDFNEEFFVEEFLLIKSVPTKEGHKYKVLEKFSLMG